MYEARILIEVARDTHTEGPGVVARGRTLSDLALDASTKVMDALLAARPVKHGASRTVTVRYDPDDEPEKLERPR